MSDMLSPCVDGGSVTLSLHVNSVDVINTKLQVELSQHGNKQESCETSVEAWICSDEAIKPALEITSSHSFKDLIL